MGWIIAACALGILVVILIALYRRALRENRNLTNYALLILLDESVHASQRKALTEFVRTADAKNATELSGIMQSATTQFAERLADTMLGTRGLLWKLKGTEPTV
jgi:hypothetical protein